MRRGSLSSELPMCGGGVRSILLLPLVARYLETIDVCIWRMLVFMSVVLPCGSGAFSLEKGRIAPLPLPRHVVRGDYLECLAM